MGLIDFVAGPVAFSGLPWAVRQVLSRQAVTVLVYHDPAPEVFDRHVEWLKHRYSIVPIDRAVNALYDGDMGRLGINPLVITIDDGHRGNIDLLPVIRKHDIRPCIYLCSAIIGTNRPFSDYLVSAKYPDLRGKFKQQGEAGRRRMFRELFGMELETELDEPMALGRDEILELAPFVDFGSHGRFHQSMPRLEKEDLRREMVLSRQEIEALSGMPCRHFSFPTGLYDDAGKKMGHDAGYLSMRTTDVGFNLNREDLQGLKVTGASDDASLVKLEVQASGIYRLVRQLVWR